jgi:hypothetical protein
LEKKIKISKNFFDGFDKLGILLDLFFEKTIAIEIQF